MVGVGWSRGAVVLAALALTFCGSEPRPGPSAPVPDAGQADAGVPDAGLADAGVADAGQPDAGVPDAGQPDAGVPDAGDHDGGDDGAPDGGTSDLACAGLKPAGDVGAPLRLELTTIYAQDFTHFCLPGTSDGSGHLLIGSQNEFQAHDTQLFFYATDGTPLGAASGVGFDPLPQASGFLGIDLYGASLDWDAVSFSGDGSVVTRSESSHSTRPWATTDPLGGMRVWNDTSTSPWTSSHGTLIAYDAQLGVRWQLPLDGPGHFAAFGVDRAGNTLLLFSDGTELQGLWVHADGTVEGGLFDAGAAPADGEPMLAARVGDGLFLQSVVYGVEGNRRPEHGRWVAQFSPRSRHAEPAPAWLTPYADTALHMVHGGRGYALLPLQDPAAVRCAQTVRIFAPSGEACGQETYVIDEDACQTAPLTVGYDGSVFQILPKSRQTGCAGDHCPCTYRVWPGRFR
jgi:hypothetical protein